MASNANFTIKTTLDRANIIRRALVFYKKDLDAKVAAAAPGDMPALGQEALEVDYLLRVDF